MTKNIESAIVTSYNSVKWEAKIGMNVLYQTDHEIQKICRDQFAVKGGNIKISKIVRIEKIYIDENNKHYLIYAELENGYRNNLQCMLPLGDCIEIN